MQTDKNYSAYVIVPLYNVSIDNDILNMNIGEYNIVTNDFIFQNLDDKLYNKENLYEDIQKPHLGTECKRPLAKYALFKKIDYVGEFLNKNQQIQEQLVEDIAILLIAMRIAYKGNIQINRCYIFAERGYCSLNLNLSTSLDYIYNFIFIKNNMYFLDNYILSKNIIKFINEFKNDILMSKLALWIPISYFMSYYSTTDLIEKIIKLCTVWETTLLNDRKAELQYCLRVRGSSLLNSDLNLMFKIAYDIRSQLIHTGNINSTNLLHKLVDKGKDDTENLFIFIKDHMEPVTRDILKKIIIIHLKTGKNLEKIAKSIDDEIFTKLST